MRAGFNYGKTLVKSLMRSGDLRNMRRLNLCFLRFAALELLLQKLGEFRSHFPGCTADQFFHLLVGLWQLQGDDRPLNRVFQQVAKGLFRHFLILLFAFLLLFHGGQGLCLFKATTPVPKVYAWHCARSEQSVNKGKVLNFSTLPNKVWIELGQRSYS